MCVCVCVCVQNFKSEKKLQVPASIRKLLTFISSMLYTLHNTWGDVLLVVLVNLRKNKKKKIQKSWFPWLSLSYCIYQCRPKMVKEWWLSSLDPNYNLFSCPGSQPNNTIVTATNQQKNPTNCFWGPNTSFYRLYILQKKWRFFFLL